MKIKIKNESSSGLIRTEHNVEIKEVMINEDFLDPGHESIALAFRNKDTSGIIEFKVAEFEKFSNSIRRKVHLVKSVRAFGREGAVNLEER